jgi:hypothetical protein
MSRIYTNANRVLVWLGREADDSDLAMNCILKRHYTIQGELYGEFKAHEQTALFKFCEREYWHRMWILQEFQLPRHVRLYCGNLSVDCKALQHLHIWEHWKQLKFRNYDSTSAYKVVHNRIMLQAPDHERERRVRGRLFDMVMDFRSLRCADPRDKVYALLGLAVDCKENDFPIDYTKSLFSVFCDLLSRYKGRKKYCLGRGEGVEQCMKLSDLLQLTIEDLLKEYPEFPSGFWPPCTKSQRGAGYHNFPIRNFNKIGKDADRSMFQEAEDSLSEFSLQPSARVFDWFESEDDLNDISHFHIQGSYLFQKWPLKFPAKVRSMIKLQLFVEKYGQRGMLYLQIRKRDVLVLLVDRAECKAKLVIQRDTGETLLTISRRPPHLPDFLQSK